MRLLRLSAALFVLTLVACGAAPTPEPWPVDPEAPMRPDAMVVEPPVADAGAVVAVSYPNGWERGILYAIDRELGDGWERRYLLVSDASGGQPTWFAAGDDENAVVEAIGIAGSGPDRVQLPDELEPGAYRICTANAADAVCSPIEVVAP